MMSLLILELCGVVFVFEIGYWIQQEVFEVMNEVLFGFLGSDDV